MTPTSNRICNKLKNNFIWRVSFVAAFFVVGVSQADAVPTFDFESTTFGFFNPLVVTSEGLTLTVTPDGFPGGSVSVRFTDVSSLGSRSVIGSQLPSSINVNSFAPLRFAFDQPVSDVTFAFGDAGGDNDTPVTIEAYDAGNTLLGTLNDTYPAGFSVGKKISGSFSGARYFILSSGVLGQNADSILWEVPSVTIIPEPTTCTLALAALCLAMSRRRAF